tara:strand:+ start:1222 stop:2331 length:1110 start_codon:yes stop_codon:yes gene_type:complete
MGLKLDLIADGFSKPIYLCAPKEIKNELYIAEQRGQIIKIDGMGNKTTFLDIRKKVKNPTFPGDERGLLGMAFHPDYKKNGYFFVNYIDNLENTIISKFKYDDKNEEFKETILIKIKQPYSNHNGGQIEFGPDGFLYIGLGDGGSSGDPDKNSQNLTNLFGKILRINVNDSLYTIPADNPFINNDSARHEIWAYGLRNPWRFSFDTLNNLIFIADVGQNSWEEVNIQYANTGGLNYGWNIREGSYPYSENSYTAQLTNPTFEYSSNANYGKTLAGFSQSSNAIGCSVTGGYFYSKEDIPLIKDHYLFSDYCTGKIWGLKKNNADYTLTDFSSIILKNMKKQLYISSFGVDSEDNIYIVNHTGEIYKITN